MSQVSPLNEKQQEAIEARGCNILVSAPAGSGKTKILVTRILERLKEGVGIDQFLVLTFTQAAAKEMKQRLSGMLEEEILQAKGPLRTHLEAQKAKLPLAFITNFHGFCNQLIDRYGYLVKVKSGYEILSDQEQLLREALTLTIDQALNDETFCRFRQTYFPNRNDLEDQILKLYEVLQALGDREAFFKHMDEDIYGFLMHQNGKDLSEWCFYPQIQAVLRDVVIRILVGLEDLKLFCARHGITPFYDRPISQGPGPRQKAIPYEALKNYYQEMLVRLEPGKTFQELHVWAYQKPEPSYTIPWKDLGDEVAAHKNALSTKKTALNSQFKHVYEALIDSSQENTMLVYQEAYKAVRQMLFLTLELEKVYRDLKEKRNVLDFNDLERYATALLQPSLPVAKSLNQTLSEIMVDEYQDTNMVQETIVNLIAQATPSPVPCFMVGDMKQSIYRFRQADPEIFKAKYDAYPLSKDAMRIDLGYNYRSSKVVLDSINFIFHQIMDAHVGSLEYYRDPSAQLNYDFLRKEGAEDTAMYEEVKAKAIQRMQKAKDDFTEVLMVDADSSRPLDLDDAEYEAYMIGQRIIQMVHHGMDGQPLNYSDIAVLMRQTTHFMVYKKVFDRLEIPTTIVLSRGFLNSMEISQMKNVYQALNNPYQDFALYSVLRAPFDFSYFSDEMIAKARQAKRSLYESIQENPDFASFIEIFEDLRYQLKQMPFSRFQRYFFEKSGYLKRVSGMKNGRQRYQNLCLLVEKIAEKEKEIYHIQDWIDYFDGLGSSQDAPAVMPKDQQAVVFMTIHKSKGLEFPVVFVAMHDKRFNLQDGQQRLIFDRHLSMSMKPCLLRDFEDSLFGQTMSYQDVVVEYDNPFLALLSRILNQESISEEMRIYYVALTRAGKKLILTGTLSHEQFKQYQLALLSHQSQKMPESEGHQGWILNRKMRQANCYLDWLMPCILRHPDVLKQLSDDPLMVELQEYFPFDYATSLENTKESRFIFQWLSHEEVLKVPLPSRQVQAVVEDKPLFASANYSYLEAVEAPQSIAVTALSKHESTIMPVTKMFFQEGLDAASIGTLVHEFMEFIPLNQSEPLSEVLASLYQKGRYTKEEYLVLKSYLPKCEAFRKSACFEEMVKAEQCLKEQPFCCLYEGQLVHGTMDVLCLSASKAVIIDYKTDRVSPNVDDQVLIDRHRQQLGLYKQALEVMKPNVQVEAYLYYLEISRWVKVN